MRTDVHAPKNFKPEDYTFLACGNHQTADTDAYSPMHLINEMVKMGYRFGDVHGSHNCSHCGAFIIYYAILCHGPTRTMIHVGETCLDNRFSMANADFQQLRKEAKLNRERKALANKRAEFIAIPANREAFDYAVEHQDDEFCYKYASYIKRYGEASEKFTAAILRSKQRQAQWEAERAAEQALAKPVIEGKQRITGTIKSLKYKPTPYGGDQLKMVVMDDRGFKVWGSVPAVLADEIESLPGTFKEKLPLRVAFNATVTKSADDETFGFFKRPTNSELSR